MKKPSEKPKQSQYYAANGFLRGMQKKLLNAPLKIKI